MESDLPVAVRIIIAKERCLHCRGTLWFDEGEWKCSMCGRSRRQERFPTAGLVSLVRTPLPQSDAPPIQARTGTFSR